VPARPIDTRCPISLASGDSSIVTESSSTRRGFAAELEEMLMSKLKQSLHPGERRSTSGKVRVALTSVESCCLCGAVSSTSARVLRTASTTRSVVLPLSVVNCWSIPAMPPCTLTLTFHIASGVGTETGSAGAPDMHAVAPKHKAASAGKPKEWRMLASCLGEIALSANIPHVAANAVDLQRCGGVLFNQRRCVSSSPCQLLPQEAVRQRVHVCRLGIVRRAAMATLDVLVVAHVLSGRFHLRHHLAGVAGMHAIILG
jgi:hypothetical protein